MVTRTWMTTPIGSAPEGEATHGERWVDGPAVPVEPTLPNRYRGAIVQASVLALACLLTLAIGGSISENTQDPTFGETEEPDAPEIPGEGDA